MTRNESPYTKSDLLVAFLFAISLAALMLPPPRHASVLFVGFDILAPIVVGVPALLYLLAKPTAVRRRTTERIILDAIPANRALTASEIIGLVADRPRDSGSLEQRQWDVQNTLQAISCIGRSPKSLQREHRLFPERQCTEERFLLLDTGDPSQSNSAGMATKPMIRLYACIGAVISSFIVGMFIHPHPFFALLLTSAASTAMFWRLWRLALGKLLQPKQSEIEPEAFNADVRRCFAGKTEITYRQICDAVPRIDANPIDHGLRIALAIRDLEDRGIVQSCQGATTAYKIV